MPINRTLRHSLEDYLNVRPKVQDDHLLISERQQGMDTDTIHNWIKKMADLAKIEDISYHCLVPERKVGRGGAGRGEAGGLGGYTGPLPVEAQVCCTPQPASEAITPCGPAQDPRLRTRGFTGVVWAFARRPALRAREPGRGPATSGPGASYHPVG